MLDYNCWIKISYIFALTSYIHCKVSEHEMVNLLALILTSYEFLVYRQEKQSTDCLIKHKNLMFCFCNKWNQSQYKVYQHFKIHKIYAWYLSLCIFANFKPDLNNGNNFANSYKQCPSVRKKKSDCVSLYHKEKTKKVFFHRNTWRNIWLCIKFSQLSTSSKVPNLNFSLVIIISFIQLESKNNLEYNGATTQDQNTEINDKSESLKQSESRFSLVCN